MAKHTCSAVSNNKSKVIINVYLELVGPSRFCHCQKCAEDNDKNNPHLKKLDRQRQAWASKSVFPWGAKSERRLDWGTGVGGGLQQGRYHWGPAVRGGAGRGSGQRACKVRRAKAQQRQGQDYDCKQRVKMSQEIFMWWVEDLIRKAGCKWLVREAWGEGMVRESVI